jgi:hypothetical protein
VPEVDRVAGRISGQRRGDLVGVEEERRDREAGGVGAGAVLAASLRGVDEVQAPDHQTLRLEGARVDFVHAVGLVEEVALHHEQVAVVAVVVAGEPRLTLDRGARRYRHRAAHRLAVAVVVAVRARQRDDGARRCAGRRVHHAESEQIDLHPSEAEPTLGGQGSDHRRRLHVGVRRGDVLVPHRGGREARQLLGGDLRSESRQQRGAEQLPSTRHARRL